jgi:hypothetical protein
MQKKLDYTMVYRIIFSSFLFFAFVFTSCEDSHYIEKDKEIRIISKEINNDDTDGISPTLRKVVAVSKDKAWSCDSTGLMLLTINEGNDWQNIDIDDQIFDMTFENEMTGWILTYDKILYTNNACKTFKIQKHLTERFYRDLYFKDISKLENTIAVALNTKYLAISKNSGQVWYFSHIGNHSEFTHCIVTEKDKAFYFSKDSIFFNKIVDDKVINGSFPLKIKEYIVDVKNFKNSSVWIATKEKIYLTNTDFNTYTIIFSVNDGDEIISIDLFDENRGVVLIKNNNGSEIKITNDNNEEWRSLHEDSGDLLDIDFIDEFTGFAVGKGLALTITK